MTHPTLIAIRTFVGKNENMLASLWARWQDEKEYEDINEYGARIAKEFPEGWKLLKSTKRPFGVHVEIDGLKWEISVTATGIKWKHDPSKK